jgi:hypothetical protein
MHHPDKLDRAYSEGAFGVPDVPKRIGHKHLAKATHQWTDFSGREDKRSWKRRRKTRWRPK